MLHLTVEQARGFYAEHEGRPFFDGLVEFMTSGPIVVSVWKAKTRFSVTVICWARPTRQTRWRVPYALTTLTASPGTAPTVSDSVKSAAREIAFFFAEGEVCPRTR